MSHGNKRSCKIKKKMQLKATGLFKYVWPFLSQVIKKLTLVACENNTGSRFLSSISAEG